MWPKSTGGLPQYSFLHFPCWSFWPRGHLFEFRIGARIKLWYTIGSELLALSGTTAVPVGPLLLFPDWTAITSSKNTATITTLQPDRKPAINLGNFPLKRWYWMLQNSTEDQLAVTWSTAGLSRTMSDNRMAIKSTSKHLNHTCGLMLLITALGHRAFVTQELFIIELTNYIELSAFLEKRPVAQLLKNFPIYPF
jgi:hypothetical protein